MKHFTLGNIKVRRVLLTVAVAMAAVFVPQNVQADEYYGLEVAGVKVTDQNCDDLSVIDGVSGTVWYDEHSNALYMKDAKMRPKTANPGYWRKSPWKWLTVSRIPFSRPALRALCLKKAAS